MFSKFSYHLQLVTAGGSLSKQERLLPFNVGGGTNTVFMRFGIQWNISFIVFILKTFSKFSYHPKLVTAGGSLLKQERLLHFKYMWFTLPPWNEGAQPRGVVYYALIKW